MLGLIPSTLAPKRATPEQRPPLYKYSKSLSTKEEDTLGTNRLTLAAIRRASIPLSRRSQARSTSSPMPMHKFLESIQYTLSRSAAAVQAF